ncbi:MAG TPA: hypothetical protein VGD22_09100, partial [Sphingobacteriaceae bacterium]
MQNIIKIVSLFLIALVFMALKIPSALFLALILLVNFVIAKPLKSNYFSGSDTIVNAYPYK